MSTWAGPHPQRSFIRASSRGGRCTRRWSGRTSLDRHNALAGRGVYLSVVDAGKIPPARPSRVRSRVARPATRLLTWTWPRWIPLDTNARALGSVSNGWSIGAALQIPALLVWGREDDVFDRGGLRHPFQAAPSPCQGPYLVAGRNTPAGGLRTRRSPPRSSILADAREVAQRMNTCRTAVTVVEASDLAGKRHARRYWPRIARALPEFRDSLSGPLRWRDRSVAGQVMSGAIRRGLRVRLIGRSGEPFPAG